MEIKPLDLIEPVKKLLAKSGLPTEDISQSISIKFYGVVRGDTLVAVIGIELYGKVGLLRSLAVDPSLQNNGTGRRLVHHAESVSIQHGVKQLYLLTTTAKAYFQRIGYTSKLKAEAPAAIRATSQFSKLCPNSSAFLVKQLQE